jgi:signal transduction histidine kinase
LIEGRVNHLDYILRDIVAIAFNSAVPPFFERVDLVSEVSSLIKGYASKHPTVECSFEIDQPNEIIFNTDLTRLKSILRNVISNAFKYRNTVLKQQFVKIHIEVNEANAFFVVQDNGIGIGREYHEKIFSLFYKATVSHKGNGLGLTIVKSMVSKLGGEINLTSDVGKGSIFKITIPNSIPGNN